MRADRVVTRAAQACALGIPGFTMLTTTDSVEYQLLDNLTSRAHEAWLELAQDQAKMTATQIGKLFGG